MNKNLSKLVVGASLLAPAMTSRTVAALDCPYPDNCGNDLQMYDDAYNAYCEEQGGYGCGAFFHDNGCWYYGGCYYGAWVEFWYCAGMCS